MPDAALPPLPLHHEFSVVARRFNCIPTRQRWLFFGILAGFSLGVATAATALGAWPVLPYSVVELAVIAAAFWYVERRSRDWERLTIAADRVILERAWDGRNEKREFNRHWVRVELAARESLWGERSHLQLSYAGEAVVFGEALAQDERARVARELRQRLARR